MKATNQKAHNVISLDSDDEEPLPQQISKVLEVAQSTTNSLVLTTTAPSPKTQTLLPLIKSVKSNHQPQLEAPVPSLITAKEQVVQSCSETYTETTFVQPESQVMAFHIAWLSTLKQQSYSQQCLMCLTCWQVILESEKSQHPHKNEKGQSNSRLHTLSGNFFQMQSATRTGILGMANKFKRCSSQQGDSITSQILSLSSGMKRLSAKMRVPDFPNLPAMEVLQILHQSDLDARSSLLAPVSQQDQQNDDLLLQSDSVKVASSCQFENLAKKSSLETSAVGQTKDGAAFNTSFFTADQTNSTLDSSQAEAILKQSVVLPLQNSKKAPEATPAPCKLSDVTNLNNGPKPQDQASIPSQSSLQKQSKKSQNIDRSSATVKPDQNVNNIDRYAKKPSTVNQSEISHNQSEVENIISLPKKNLTTSKSILDLNDEAALISNSKDPVSVPQNNPSISSRSSRMTVLNNVNVTYNESPPCSRVSTHPKHQSIPKQNAKDSSISSDIIGESPIDEIDQTPVKQIARKAIVETVSNSATKSNQQIQQNDSNSSKNKLDQVNLSGVKRTHQQAIEQDENSQLLKDGKQRGGHSTKTVQMEEPSKQNQVVHETMNKDGVLNMMRHREIGTPDKAEQVTQWNELIDLLRGIDGKMGEMLEETRKRQKTV